MYDIYNKDYIFSYGNLIDFIITVFFSDILINTFFCLQAHFSVFEHLLKYLLLLVSVKYVELNQMYIYISVLRCRKWPKWSSPVAHLLPTASQRAANEVIGHLWRDIYILAYLWNNGYKEARDIGLCVFQLKITKPSSRWWEAVLSWKWATEPTM